MELEPEPYFFKGRNRNRNHNFFKSRNRNRNHNFSKVGTGTGTVKNSYGSTTLGGRVYSRGGLQSYRGHWTYARKWPSSVYVLSSLWYCSPVNGGGDDQLVESISLRIRIRIRRIRMFLGLLDPDPDPCSQRYGSGSFYHQSKIVRKTLISTPLWLLFDFLALEIDVNVPSKSNKQFFVAILKVDDKNSRIRIRIRIHIKMSWFRNTGLCL
jgi:hypothetical protein